MTRQRTNKLQKIKISNKHNGKVVGILKNMKNTKNRSKNKRIKGTNR